jgi:hypothetical protein
MELTIQNEANRLYSIFVNSYDYFYENLLLNQGVDLKSNYDIGNRLSCIMPAGGSLSSFISGLYFEKNVIFQDNMPLENKDYAFTSLVISELLRKAAIFSVGKWGNYKKESYHKIYSDHESWIDQVVIKNEKDKFKVIENAPHNATLSFLNVPSKDWGWDGGVQYAYLIGAINNGIGEKNLNSSKYNAFTRNIIKKI